MTRPIIAGINIQTGEVLEREYNDEEYAEYLIQVEKTIGMYPDIDDLVEGEQPQIDEIESVVDEPSEGEQP